MEEEGFVKKGSLSSSSSWASRLSPLAQPFTMKRQEIEPLNLNSSITPKPTKHFAPSPSNHVETFDDYLLPNSLADLINLEDDQVLLPVLAPNFPPYSQPVNQSESSLSASAFPFDGTKASFSRFSVPSSSLAYETELDGLSFDYKSSVSSSPVQCSVYQGQRNVKDGKSFVFSSEASATTHKSFVKQDSMNPLKVSTGPDVLSLSTFQNVTQVPANGSTGTSSTFSLSIHASPSIGGLTGNAFAKINHGSCGGNLSAKPKLNVANSHVIRQEKILFHEEKDKNDVKSVSCKGLDPLLIPKSEFKVTSDDTCDGLILGKSGTISGLSLDSSSKWLDENDEDLDSPCWKGIQNSGKSPQPVSECLSSKSLQNESEASPSLNPQAPHFFPSNGKGIMDYSKNNSVGDGFQSSSGVSNTDKKHMEPLKVGPNPPGFSNASKYQYSNSIHETGKERFLLNKNSQASTSPNLPQSNKPSLVDEVLPTMNLAMDQVQNFPSSGLDPRHESSQLLQSVMLSSSRCPNPNISVNMVVKAIRYLSELLVENCTNGYDSLNANENETIQCVIDNLYVLINPGLRPGGLDYRGKATTVHERPNMKFQAKKDLVIQPELDGWRNNNWVNSYSQASAWEMNANGSSSSNTELGNNVNQYDTRAFRMALKENGQINGNLDSNALLSLWIETQAALCSVKYENRILRRHLHMEGLWGVGIVGRSSDFWKPRTLLWSFIDGYFCN